MADLRRRGIMTLEGAVRVVILVVPHGEWVRCSGRSKALGRVVGRKGSQGQADARAQWRGGLWRSGRSAELRGRALGVKREGDVCLDARLALALALLGACLSVSTNSSECFLVQRSNASTRTNLKTLLHSLDTGASSPCPSVRGCPQ